MPPRRRWRDDSRSAAAWAARPRTASSNSRATTARWSCRSCSPRASTPSSPAAELADEPELLHRVALALELVDRVVDLALREVLDLEALDDLVVAAGAADGEGGDEPLLDAVLAA